MDLSDVARRRMHRIACHIGAVHCTPCSASATSLATLVCSSDSGILSGSRKDNRLLHSRQGSHTQAFYMRQSTGSKVCSSDSGILSGSRKDNRLLYSRQGSHTQAFYMRQSTGSKVMVSNEEGCTAVIDKTSSGEVLRFFPKQDWQLREPLFSKPVSDSKDITEYGGPPSVEGVPLFARRADDADGKMQSKNKQLRSENIGIEWHPRMDIVESGSAYVVTVELPGVDAESIQVEVNSNRLIITGTRSTERWLNLTKVSRSTIYHRRELSQGPYRVLWHIPRDANVDFITAEFIDGFLQIRVAKFPA